jgi:hypothetical protein
MREAVTNNSVAKRYAEELAVPGCRRKLYLGLNGLGDVDHRISPLIACKSLVHIIFRQSRVAQIDAKYHRFAGRALAELVKRA